MIREKVLEISFKGTSRELVVAEEERWKSGQLEVQWRKPQMRASKLAVGGSFCFEHSSPLCQPQLSTPAHSI